MKEYDFVYVEISYQDKKVIIFQWGARHIGFGELVIDAKTHELLNDEGMSKEFCNQVIKLGLK